MINLEIKDIYFDFDQNKIINEAFSIFVEVEIGIKGEEGAEIFSFNLCNRLGLLLLFDQLKTNRLDKKFSFDSLNGWNVIVCENFDKGKLLEWINLHLKKVGRIAKDWKTAAVILNKTFSWEYSDEINGYRYSELWD